MTKAFASIKRGLQQAIRQRKGPRSRVPDAGAVSAAGTIKPIRNDADLKNALRRIDEIFHADEGTADADELEVLAILVADYEKRQFNFGPADPIEAIKFRMEQAGLTPRDLEPFIGSTRLVADVLNRKRPLSLRMVKRLHDGLKIPYESLVAEPTS